MLAAGCGMGLFHSTYARERATGHFPEKSVGIALLVLILLISIPLAEARAASIAAPPLALAFLFSFFCVVLLCSCWDATHIWVDNCVV